MPKSNAYIRGVAHIRGQTISVIDLSMAVGGPAIENIKDSFIIIATGGLASFSGAFVAAMFIGLLRTFGIVYVPEIASMIPFIAMVAVLIWRPEGLIKVGK